MALGAFASRRHELHLLVDTVAQEDTPTVLQTCPTQPPSRYPPFRLTSSDGACGTPADGLPLPSASPTSQQAGFQHSASCTKLPPLTFSPRPTCPVPGPQTPSVMTAAERARVLSDSHGHELPGTCECMCASEPGPSVETHPLFFPRKLLTQLLPPSAGVAAPPSAYSQFQEMRGCAGKGSTVLRLSSAQGPGPREGTFNDRLLFPRGDKPADICQWELRMTVGPHGACAAERSPVLSLGQGHKSVEAQGSSELKSRPERG